MTTSPEVPVEPGTSGIEINRDARDQIGNMEAHVAALGASYGPNSDWYREAAVTYGRTVGRILAFPMGSLTRVFRDGAPLSLYMISGDIHMGVIFHAVRRRCTRPGCGVYANDDGRVWSYTDGPRCEDGEHTWLYPLDAPTPGTWSTHT